MRRLILFLFLGGCGLGSGEITGPPGPLANTQWTAPITGFECSENFVFPDSRHYTYGIGCLLLDGSSGLQIISGVYSLAGTRMILDVTDTSCPSNEIPASTTVGWSRSGDSLSIITDAEAVVMTRVYPDGTSGGTVAFGCYEANLSFMPMAVHPF